MQTLIDLLSSLSSTAIYGTALGVLLACGLGVPIPEDITLLALGYYSHTGHVDLYVSIAVAMFGVLAGDSLTFWIGRRYGERILSMPVLNHLITPNRIRLVEKSFDRYGNIFIFFARFAVGLRAPTFWASGHIGLRFRTFLLLDGLAALLSVPLFIYIGYATGGMIDKVRDYEKIIGSVAALVIISLVALTVYKHRKSDMAPDEDDSPAE